MSHTNDPGASSPRSAALYERALARIPGGVNSPVRAWRGVGGTPLFFERGAGASLTDVDGRRYVDYVGSWGPMILGHANPAVLTAIAEAAARSTSFGAPTEREVEFAELLCRVVPNLDRVRLVNSGTEACMSAIRVARGATGRTRIVKFDGCYHGHADSFLVQAGSGALTLGIPGSAGVTPGTAGDTLVARYNDLSSVAALVAEHPGEIAAVIVEPVGGNMGCIPPLPGFLEGLRILCTRHGIVLVFDEVMTGLRIAPGGAQQRYGIDADLVTLGKIVGGGLPLAAYGGRDELMRQVAPAGPVYQAGTLSGNPLAVAAGLATLQQLQAQPEIYDALERASAQLAAGLSRAAAAAGRNAVINRVGSMLSLHFTDAPAVSDADASKACDARAFASFFHAMLARGVYLPPSAYESWFVSAAHGPQEIVQTIEAAVAAMAAMAVPQNETPSA